MDEKINHILGVRIDNLSKEDILAKIKCFLDEEKFHQIATVNPEFILRSQKDPGFKNILNSCELCVADGVGVWFAFVRFGKYLKSCFAGIDLMEEILQIADQKNLSVFLVASQDGLSSWEETRKAILKKYPHLDVAGVSLNKNTFSYQIPDTRYQILFCNFGAPYQEKFLHSLKSTKSAKIRLVVGVGGSFDFLTRKIKRAPKHVRKIGMEWLWRFIQEPKYRAKRIYQAVIVFPIRILFNK